MGGGGKAPEAPDPKVTIPLQQKADMENFYAQLDAMRSNSSNPYGSSTWNRSETFDQAGYDAAMGQYETELGAWNSRPAAPSITPPPGGYFWDNPAPAGYETQTAAASAPRPEAPNRASFTSDRNYSQESAFNPEMQGQFDQLQSLQRQLMGSFDPTETIDLIDDAGGQYSNDLADAIYRRTTRMSDQNFGDAQKALEQRLAERGFQVGNEGYNTEMNRLGTQRSEHYSDAADRAQITAAQQALQEAGFTNSARLAEFQGNNQMRAQMAALLGGREGQLMAGLSGNQQQFQAPSLPGIDVLGAYNNQYMGELDAYNAGQAEDAALFNSILGLGANFLMPGAGAALGGGASAGLGALGGTMLGGSGGLGLRAPSSIWG